MTELFITLVVGLVGGLIAQGLKVPAGAMIGAMFSVAAYNIITGDAFIPQNVNVVTQIVVGAFIGSGIKRKDVVELKQVVKPAILMVLGMIILDLFIGFLMFKVTGIDLVTSLFACAPAGIVDMSLVSRDFGADTSKVAILHLVRLMSVITLLPLTVKYASAYFGVRLGKEENVNDEKDKSAINNSSRNNETYSDKNELKNKLSNFPITIITAFVAGFIGYKLKIPAGAITFSMVAVGAMNIFSNNAYIPMPITRITQICAGILIGGRMTFAELIALKEVIFPAFVLLVGIIIVHTTLGLLISRFSQIKLVTAILASAPGGMTDMALVAKDFGADAPKVAILQLTRYVSIVAIFPIIIKYIS